MIFIILKFKNKNGPLASILMPNKSDYHKKDKTQKIEDFEQEDKLKCFEVFS